jgi:large subunit ribosomal protein L6
MIFSGYIFKPPYIEFMELPTSYLVITGLSEAIKVPKFLPHKSAVSRVRSELNKLSQIVKTAFQILHVKGIGFKVYYYRKQHSLYFNLGYNHLCKYKLDRLTYVKVRKQYTLVYSRIFSKFNLSVYEIRHLRYPDPYRGKGIRFRFQHIIFKPGKQR